MQEPRACALAGRSAKAPWHEVFHIKGDCVTMNALHPSETLLSRLLERLDRRFPYLRAGDALIRCLGAAAERDGGGGNRLLGDPAGLRIAFSPTSSGNLVAAGDYGQLNAVLDVDGDDNLVLLLGNARKFGGRITVRGKGNLFFFGERATCNAGNFVLVGDGLAICFGTDCMLSQNVSVRASDSHGILDLRSEQVINPPADILVGHHVWLGYSSTVLKGTRIGSGAVVGAGALVTSDLPPCTLAVGVPARPLRDGVSWSRHQSPSPQQIAEVVRRVSELPTP